MTFITTARGWWKYWGYFFSWCRLTSFQLNISFMVLFLLQVFNHCNFKYVRFVYKWCIFFDVSCEFWKVDNIPLQNFKWGLNNFPNWAGGCLFRWAYHLEKEVHIVFEVAGNIFRWGFIPLRKLCIRFICENVLIRFTATWKYILSFSSFVSLALILKHCFSG